jgi:hypothetical protein
MVGGRWRARRPSGWRCWRRLGREGGGRGRAGWATRRTAPVENAEAGEGGGGEHSVPGMIDHGVGALRGGGGRGGGRDSESLVRRSVWCTSPPPPGRLFYSFTVTAAIRCDKKKTVTQDQASGVFSQLLLYGGGSGACPYKAPVTTPVFLVQISPPPTVGVYRESSGLDPQLWCRRMQSLSCTNWRNADTRLAIASAAPLLLPPLMNLAISPDAKVQMCAEFLVYLLKQH